MKKIFIIPILCLFFVFIACNNRKQADTAGTYYETITENDTEIGNFTMASGGTEIDEYEETSLQVDNFVTSEHASGAMSNAVNLTLGTSVEGKFDSVSKWYKIDLSGSSWLRVSFVGNRNIETQLSIYNNEGLLIAKDSRVSSIEIIIGVSAGLFFVEISGTDQHGDHGYTLSAATAPSRSNNDSKEFAKFISVGVSVNDSFLPNTEGINERWYKLELPSNSQGVTIYTEGALNIITSVFDNTDRLVTRDSNSGYVYNPRVDITGLGMIYIKVEEYHGATGDFRLTVQGRQ